MQKLPFELGLLRSWWVGLGGFGAGNLQFFGTVYRVTSKLTPPFSCKGAVVRCVHLEHENAYIGYIVIQLMSMRTKIFESWYIDKIVSKKLL